MLGGMHKKDQYFYIVIPGIFAAMAVPAASHDT